jgi:methyl-accepting chemotaxis protein
MKELTSLVIVKTEESALNLTENIFQISNKSSQVGNQISNFLNDMFYGDKSLKSNIDILKSEMKRIDSLITDFTSIKERYTLDMRQIENNVKVINGFLSGIRDVSDRTGLLAINSSIEAARVGTAGKGFSVLAGEIHGLAKSSKDISLQIDDIVKIISETVGESFRFLESEISNSLEELSQTQADLNSISTNLTDKVSDVEDHVKDSDNLSKTVTAQLNNVSVNMQYQDITRQILEHIMGTLYFYRTKLEENDSRMIAQNDKKEKKETIIKQASAFFTIEDEWKLFGLETVPAVPTDRKDHEYKGNVELF